MKNFLKFEQLVLFIAIIYIYYQLDYSWMWFAILFLTPDIFMLGYLFGTKIGAISYNFIHNYATTILIIAIGYFTKNDTITMIGLIFSAHIAMDRLLGFGLKYFDDFKSTHLSKL